MSQAEQTQAILDARARFYDWEPPGNPFQSFRCYHNPSQQQMSEKMCMTRAGRPDLYQEDCGGKVHGRRCPRWKHYTKEIKLACRELIKNLNPQPLRRRQP